MDKKHGEKETTFTDGTKIKLSLFLIVSIGKWIIFG